MALLGGELTEKMCQMRGESQSELSEPGVADMYTYMRRIHITTGRISKLQEELVHAIEKSCQNFCCAHWIRTYM